MGYLIPHVLTQQVMAIAVVTVLVLVSLGVPGDVHAESCSGVVGGIYDPTPTRVDVKAVPIVVESTDEEYFVLYALHEVGGTTIEIPVLVALGQNGTTALAESLSALPKERYMIEKYLIADPADIDGDCVDDITELNNPGGMNPMSGNPINMTAIDISDGAMSIPDFETFEALSYHNRVQFVVLGVEIADPHIYFINHNTHSTHTSFLNSIDARTSELWPVRSYITYIPGGNTHEHINNNLIDGGFFDRHGPAYGDDGPGVFVYHLHFNYWPFSVADLTNTMLAANMPVTEDNLTYFISDRIDQYQHESASYATSRIDVMLNHEIAVNDEFTLLNHGEGYGILRVMEPDERPNPRDVVIYESLPNNVPRVAGIITTSPQTPLSHANLRAIQDGIPNSFIRDALSDPSITGLIDRYVHYTVSDSGWTISAATNEQANAHHASVRPATVQTPQMNLTVTSITPLDDVRFDDWDTFGVKAANVAVLLDLGFSDGTVPDGFAIPFYFYDEFMKHNGLYDRINAMLTDSDFQDDLAVQESELKKLRKAIKKADTPAWIVTALEDMHGEFSNGTSLRYRSSTNNEDLPGFNGAGLYDSKTQHPEETTEDGISKSLKQVYASLWNLHAYLERDFHRINHTTTAMGVLVHPNYSDELANGVAVSFDPLDNTPDTYYINTQIGEDLVTNPDVFSVPEELKLSKTAVSHRSILTLDPDNSGFIERNTVTFPEYSIIATSNQMPPWTLLLNHAQMDQLRKHLSVIHAKFENLYGISPDEEFAMEVEFKITSDNVLAIKQARPWVFGHEMPAVDAGSNRTGHGATSGDGSGEIPTTVAGLANSPPIADAGTSQTVQEGTAVTLNGTASDPDGDVPTYLWTHNSTAPDIIFENATTLITTFTAPQVDFDTAIAMTLTVDDGNGATATSSVSITIADIPATLTPESQPASTVTLDPVGTPGPRDIGRITMIATATGAIQATWDAPSEAPANYRISWAKTGDPYLTWTNSTGNAFPTGPAHTITGLEEGEAYKVKVRASYAGTAGDWSGKITITVARSANNPPSVDAGEPVAVREGAQVTLNATASDQDGDQLTYSWNHDSTPDISMANADSLSPTFTAPQVSANTTVAFILTADDGTDTRSDTVTVTILDVPAVGTPNGGSGQNTTTVLNPDELLGPRDIGRITMTGAQPGTIQASWEAPSETPAGYRISWAKVDESYLTWTDRTGNAFPTDPSHTITGLEGGETYKVKVRATYEGDWSDGVTATVAEAPVVHNTPATGMPVITGTVQVGHTLTADISGIADADGITGVSFNYLWISDNGTDETEIGGGGGGDGVVASRHVLTADDLGDTIKVRVEFTDDAGHAESLTSAATHAVAPAYTVPGVPANLLVSQGDSGGILKVSWQAPASNGGSNLTGYTVQWKVTSDSWAIPADIAEATVTGTAHTITGLTDGTPYAVRVLATNVIGDGKPTSEETATPQAPVPLRDPRDIGVVTLNSTVPGIVTVSWDAPDQTPANYRVSWAKAGEPYLARTDSVGNAFPTVPFHTITGLEEGGEYRVKVRASYSGTSGDWSDEVTATVAKTFHPFITTWQTTVAGESITIPVGGATGIYTIDWGDGNVNYGVSGDQIHTYDDAGTYTVRIYGDFARIYLNGQQPNADKLQSIEQWGSVRWESMRSAFQGTSSMAYRATDTPDLSDVISMRYMFRSAASFNADLSAWDVSSVTDMRGMFYNAASFNADLSAWDVSSVTDMREMFYNAVSFNGDLSAWDVSSVTDMSHMFRSAASFNADLSAWDVSSVTDMSHMFRSAASFNADLSAWDVSSVTDMSHMFRSAASFNADLSAWDVSSVTDMSYMFRSAASFNADLSAWDVSSVTDMRGMFYNVASFNGDLSAWDVSSVTDMRGMFMGAASFNADLSAWDVSSVTDMSHMFRNAASFNADLSAWDVSSVTAMSQMFQNTASFNANLSAWNVSRVIDMDAMFDDTRIFDQNLGMWYIVLDDTVIEGGNSTGTIGTIAAQNSFLDGQNPIYGIEPGGDSDHFEVDGTALKLRTTAQNSLAGGSYTITITSTGEFGTGNSRTYEIVVTDTHANP